MLETLERLEPFTPAAPVNHIMANYFNKFIRYWSKDAEIRYLGDAHELALQMPIERRVYWDGNAQGTLVVRCHENFMEWLKKNKGNKRLNFETSGQCLNEMVELYATYLINNFWRPESLKIGPLSTQPSRPEDWPGRQADAAFCLSVEGHPVEIRFWMGDLD
jgi:hypothetical protein